MIDARTLARLLVAFLAASLAASYANAQNDPPLDTVRGASMEVYGHEVTTWARVDANDTVRQVGVTVPMGVIDDAESDEHAEAEGEGPPAPHSLGQVAFPELVRDVTFLNHLEVHWEAQGHPPGPFLVPHFDFHFNAISPGDVEAIDCTDVSAPDASLVPEGYVVPPEECVPAMGQHGIPASDVERTEPFSTTFILGYYGGDPIFLEPMITRDFLRSLETYETEVPSVPVGGDVAYPEEFTASYDAEADAYQLVFTGFASGG